MDNTAYLSIDIGSRQTRVWLFTREQGSYSCRCSALAQTTCADGEDIQSGVYTALNQMQAQGGYRLLDHRQQLLVGKNPLGEGVRAVGLSLSAGKPIRTAILGISETYSLAALRRLVNFFYTDVVLEIPLQADLNATAQLEKLMAADVDLFVLAGGVDGGASRQLRAAIDNLRIVYQNQPKHTKPQIVFCGNKDLSDYAASELDFGEDVHLAPNILTGVGTEHLPAGWDALLAAFARIREQQLPGLKAFEQKTGAQVMPTSYAMGRVVRLLERISPSGKGVMAVDVGAGSTTLMAAHADDFIGTITQTPISADIGKATCRFSSQPIDAEAASIYMHNKTLHPRFLPNTLEDLAIEHAWTRVRLQYALEQTKRLYPDFDYDRKTGLVRPFEPIILSGESLIRVPAAHQSLLMAMDGMQPHGITTFAVDSNQVMAGLGTLAHIEPLIAIEMLDTGIFHNLGTTICVDSPERPGKKVLLMEVDHGELTREHYQVYKSELKRIEVFSKDRTRIYLAPSAESDVGMGYVGLGGWVTVAPSEVGVVIDARGRPLELPEDPERRSDMIYDWMWELGA